MKCSVKSKSVMLVLIIVLIKTNGLLFAQKSNFRLGPVVEDKNEKLCFGFWKTPGGYLVQKPSKTEKGNSQFALLSLDNDLKVKKVLIPDQKVPGAEPGLVYQTTSGFYITFSKNESAFKGTWIFKKLDPDNLSISENSTADYKFDLNTKGPQSVQFGGIDYALFDQLNNNQSSDLSKFAFPYATTFEKNETEKIWITVFDDTFKEIWHNKYDLNYTNELLVLESLKIDSKGNCCALARLYNKDVVEKVKGKPNYKYLLFCYFNNGEKVKEIEISASERFISDLNFSFMSDGKIFCVGLISNDGMKENYDRKAKYCKIDGVMISIIDPQNGFKTSTEIKPFEGKAFNEDILEKGNKSNIEYNYTIDYIIHRKNGSTIVTGEQSYYELMTTTLPNGKTYGVTSWTNYNNIFVADIGPDSKINWLTVVPKEQVLGNDDPYSGSYVAGFTDENVYLVFNDRIENLNVTKSSEVKPFTGPKPVIMCVKVDKVGKFSKEMLFSSKEEGVLFNPLNSDQVSNDELFLFCYENKINRYGVLKMK